MTPRQLALFVGLALIWGASYLLIKYALHGFSAAEIVFLRSALAAVVLGVYVRAQGGPALAALRAAPRRPGVAVLLGVTAVAAPFLLITIGEHTVPSGLTAVLVSPASLFVAVFAPFLDPSESIDRRQGAGLLVGLVGVALLVGVETVHSLAQFLGAIGILGAAAFYGLSGFVVKGPFGGVPAMATTTISCAVAAVVTLPVAVATMHHGGPGVRAVLSVAALGVAGTALAFVIFYRLIAEVGAGRASLVSYLAPAVALVYGAALLGEHVGWAGVGGLALVLAGVALAGRARRVTPPEPA